MFERLREDVNCVFERDPAARSVFEIVTTYPGIHAIWLHRINHKLTKAGFKWLARILSHFSRWLTGIEIHPGAQIGRRFFIDHGFGVVIGETTVIGDDCTLYQGVTLGGTSWNKGKRHPTLGNNIVVGAGAKILGPLKIGNGARIGSNAVVLKEVPAGATVVGIPGRIVALTEPTRAQKRAAIASKMGFDAYGTTKDMPDPVAHAINAMLDHIHAMDEKMDMMYQAFKRLGVDIKDIRMPDLEHCEIDSTEQMDGGTTTPEPSDLTKQRKSLSS